MSVTSLVPAVLMVGLLAAPAAAQPVPPQTEQLRKQIQALQEQLQRIETTEQENLRTARIGASRPRLASRDMVLKLYDMGDLFAIAPAYPALRGGDLIDENSGFLFSNLIGTPAGTPGGMGGMGGFFAVPDARPATVDDVPRTVLHQRTGQSVADVGSRLTVQDLIKAIQTTIAPETWQATAGGPNTIAVLGNALLINADDDTHRQVESLLDLFRQRWGTLRTVSVQAWWLWLDDAQLAALLAPQQPPVAADAVQAFGLVNEPAWTQHLQEIRQQDDATLRGYRAALTCYNGQTVHVQAGEQSLAVTRVQPVVGWNEDQTERRVAVAYRPQVDVIQEGATLQITPITNTSGKTVVLDLHSRVATASPADAKNAGVAEKVVGGLARAAEQAGPQAVVAAMDRPRLTAQQLSTTLRIPVDRTMLVGGMTFDSQPREDRPNLYLFVRVAVQELRNDRDDAQPAAPSAKPDRSDENDSTPQKSEGDALPE